MFVRLKKLSSTFKPGVFHLALVDYLVEELKKNKISCRKQTSYIRIDLEKMVEEKYGHVIIDCFNGGIYLRGENIRDKKVLKLTRFDGIRESDAMHCAQGGVKQILRYLEKLNAPKQLEVQAIIGDDYNYIDMRKKKLIDMRKNICAMKDLRGLKKTSKLKDMRKVAWHSDNNRNQAICYLDGTIIFGDNHSQCINDYIKEKVGKQLEEDTFDVNVIKQYITEMAFGHVVNNDIYLEEKSLFDVDINTVANKIKDQYPEYDIYIDGKTSNDYKKIAIKDMRKTAFRDDNTRDYAICYIDGKIVWGKTHANCVDNYLNQFFDVSLIEKHYRPDTDSTIQYRTKEEEEYLDSLEVPLTEEQEEKLLEIEKKELYEDSVDAETIRNNIKQIAFGHVDAQEKAIYLEEESAVGVDMQTFADAIKKESPQYTIYIDGITQKDCRKVAIKDMRGLKVTTDLRTNGCNRLKKVADMNGRDFAICIINGNVYEGDLHGEAVSKYLKDLGIEDIEMFDRDELDGIIGLKSQFAAAEAKGKKIFIDDEILENITLQQAAKLIKDKYPEFSVYKRNSDEVIANSFSGLKKKIRLRKYSNHDFNNRTTAIVFINGEFYEAHTHAKAINEYLANVNSEQFEDDFTRPYTKLNPESIPDKKERETTKNFRAIAKEQAFAHKVEEEKAIYIEENSLSGIDMYSAAEIFKDQYPSYTIYNDDKYDEKNDEYEYVASVTADYHDVNNRDSAIMYLAGDILEGPDHWQMIKDYMQQKYGLDRSDPSQERKTDEKFDKLSYAMGSKVDSEKMIYIDIDTINKVSESQIIKAFNAFYPDFTTVIEDASTQEYRNYLKLSMSEEDYKEYMSDKDEIENVGGISNMKRLKRIANIDLLNFVGENSKNFTPSDLRKWVLENYKDELKKYPYALKILEDMDYEGSEQFLMDLYSIATDLVYELASTNDGYITLKEVIENLKENEMHDWFLEVKKYNDKLTK